MDILRKSKSISVLNTTADSVASTAKQSSGTNFMKKEQSIRLLTVDVSNALIIAKSPNFNHNDVLLEVFAEAISVRQGAFKTEKLILLRSPNEKPAIQAVYYDDSGSAQITIGQLMRFVGHLIGRTCRFRVLKMSTVDPTQCGDLNQRLKSISLFEMSKLQNINRK